MTDRYDIEEEDTRSPEEEAEDWKPADAARATWVAEQAVGEANRAVEAARKAKKRAMAITLAVLEQYELDGVPTTLADGRRINYYTELFRTYNIADEGRFSAWEAEQDESYYTTKRVLREDIFLDECRRRHDDDEELPPGVVKVEFRKLKHKSAPKREVKGRVGK